MSIEHENGALALGLDTGEFLEAEISSEERRPERQYCVYRAGRERFCLNVLEVEEVVDWPIVTRVPLAPAYGYRLHRRPPSGAAAQACGGGSNQGRRAARRFARGHRRRRGHRNVFGRRRRVARSSAGGGAALPRNAAA